MNDQLNDDLSDDLSDDLTDINCDASDDNDNVRRQTCKITNDLDAKACHARKGLADMAGTQRRPGVSLRIFKV